MSLDYTFAPTKDERRLHRTDAPPARSHHARRRDSAYELQLDGYWALAIKTGSRVHLRSRNNKDFNARYPAVVRALAPLPDETVIDGEVVALDESGRPSFNILQNYDSSGGPIVYHVFDVLVLAGRNVMSEPLSARRDLLRDRILLKLDEPVRQSRK